MSAGSTGGGRRGFKGISKNFPNVAETAVRSQISAILRSPRRLEGSRGNRKARPEGLGRALPSRALHRHRDSLLWRLFGVRGAIVINHGEFVERILSSQHGVHLVVVDRLGPR